MVRSDWSSDVCSSDLPLLWRRIRGATSAGRVQSVALRLVCEREREVENFKPEEFWLLGAKVRKQTDPRDPFTARLARIGNEKAQITGAERAAAVKKDLEGRALRVAAVLRKETTRRAPPPFITSTLQQSASSALGYMPAVTMKIAQKLYEGEDFGEGPVGLITYMRTDSLNIAREAQEAVREFIAGRFGVECLPDRPPVFKSRDSAQEAHEAIRPTDVNRTPDKLEKLLRPDEMRLYRLIWQRFVASQMAAARIGIRTVEIEALPQTLAPAKGQTTYLFRASASEILFPGYMKVTGADLPKKTDAAPDEDAAEVEQLPPLTEGELLDCLEWLSEQKFTQPPPRYSEASLVRALEENGVGRPSTYASIISTLYNRKYVAKEKRTLLPTPLGREVNDYLVSRLPELFDVGFTAGMETQLDEIEAGKVQWTRMMKDFYQRFAAWLVAAKTAGVDPEEARKLLEALGRVQQWKPAVKRGTRTYGDEEYVKSIREQLTEGKGLSDRQVSAMWRIADGYVGGVPELAALAKEYHQSDARVAGMRTATAPCTPETLRKFELLKPVKFNEPRKVGKKTYDDKVFYESLARQGGEKGLTANQLVYVDRLVQKYAQQIPNFEALRSELNIAAPVEVPGAPAADVIALLGLFQNIQWKEPVQRGRRTWDDKEFFESLSRQHREGRTLSFKQVAALKKMAARYREQIPGFATAATQYGIQVKPAGGGRRGKDRSGE